jgi:hypothetical protein
MKRLLLILLLCCLAAHSRGQFYVQPSVGYTFNSHPTVMKSLLITDNLKSVFTMKLRYGQGLHAGVTAGYCLWDQFFIELDAKQGMLTRNSASVEETDIRELDNFYMAGFFGEIEHRSPLFQFSPRIGYRVRKEMFAASFSLGPDFMTTKVIQTMRTVDYEFNGMTLIPHDVEAVQEYKGGLHTGLQAGLGLSWSFRPDMQLVFDFVTVFNNYEIASGEVTFYEVDGVDRLESLDDTGIEIDPLDNRLNHSHYGLNIGLRYVFGRKGASL